MRRISEMDTDIFCFLDLPEALPMPETVIKSAPCPT
jgi:hypothetical protein